MPEEFWGELGLLSASEQAQMVANKRALLKGRVRKLLAEDNDEAVEEPADNKEDEDEGLALQLEVKPDRNPEDEDDDYIYEDDDNDGKDPEALSEILDSDFEDEEQGGDYDAEQYFEAGEEDFDEGGGGGEYDD
jgi:hypothetical protein